VTELLDRYGITASLGEDHLYPSNRAALSAFLAAGATDVDG
jgi:hypothetical protein